MSPQPRPRIADAHLPGVARPSCRVRCPDVSPDPGDWCESCRWAEALDVPRDATASERSDLVRVAIAEMRQRGVEL